MHRYSNHQSEEQFRKGMLRVRDTFTQTCNSEHQFSFYYTNGYLHDVLPVVTQENPDDITWMKWGLVPNNKKNKKAMEEHLKLPYSIYVNEEGLNTSPYTSESVAEHRCLVPATGFFTNRIIRQWNYMAREEREEKYPYLVQLLDFDNTGQIMPFCFPALYNHWVDDETGFKHSGFLLLATKTWGNKLMSTFESREKNSDRMPCILAYDQYQEWLDPDLDTEEAEAYLYAYDEEWMQAFSVTRKINQWSGEYNRPESIEFHPYKELGEEGKMNTIF